jgi:hypothetical protein
MRRLNVRFSQIEECIRTSLFALDNLPRTPPLRRGEKLLLQLVKEDAAALGKLSARIEFALIFDHASEDHDGSVSRRHWPNAGKTWRYILHCSETIPTAPFSLERLGLSKDYAGQGNAVYIDEADAARISPYLLEAIQASTDQYIASPRDLLAVIRNHDRVATLAPPRTHKVREHERTYRAAWKPDALKVLYDHRCQVCVHDFKPRYGVPYADTVVLGDTKGERTLSTDIVVTCPNHRAIIGETGAAFDRGALAFTFPNGLVERLILRDHLL